MQYGKLTREDHYSKGKIVRSYQHVEQSIEVTDKQSLLAEYLKAAELVLSGRSCEVEFKIIADPSTLKLRRVVKRYRLPIDE